MLEFRLVVIVLGIITVILVGLLVATYLQFKLKNKSTFKK